MGETKKNQPLSRYSDGRAHFSFNQDLTYRPHQFKAHDTVQNMVKRAEQSMADNRFKS